MATFNSRQYEYADLLVMMGSIVLFTLRALAYTKSIEREPVYGKGRRPQSIQSGNISITGEVGMLQSDLEILIAASKNRDILNANLDIIASYGGNIEEGAGVIITDRIEGVRFTETAKTLNQGDKFMEVTLPFVALDVKNQV